MPDILIRIRKLREFCGYSQEIVAERLGITQAAYSRLENGRTRLNYERIEQIAALYGLAHVDLITRSASDLIKLLLDHPDHKGKWGG